VTTGIPYLDALTSGGFIRGTTNLVIGPAGAGKTIFGLHFLLEGARRNENGLLVAMQEPPWAIRRDASGFSFFDAGFFVEPQRITMLDFTPSGWELWDPDTLIYAEESELMIEADGSLRKFHIANYFDIQFMAIDHQPEGELEPCTDLIGRRVNAEFIATPGSAYAGEILSLGLYKK